MSLINDALRRALQARRTPTQPADGPPLTPAEPPPASWPVAAVPLLLMGVLLVAVWFLQQGLQPGSRSAQSAPQPSVAAREVAGAATSPAVGSANESDGAEATRSSSDTQGGPTEPAQAEPERAAAGQSAPPAGVPVAAGPSLTNAGSLGLSTGTAQTVTMPAPTNPPPPKLKAIFYRPSDPWAMINSKTVRIGDRYGQARVVAITPDSVTLVCDGQTNVLTLEH